MAKNSIKNNNNKENILAEKNEEIIFSEQENAKKMQENINFIDNDRLNINKKTIKNIEKREKKNARKIKQQEKTLVRERKNRRKKKIKDLVKRKRKEEKQEKIKQEQTIREMEKRNKFASWFRLDNAASIYPSATNKDWNFVYRISATMIDKVDIEILQKALDEIMPRFPSFNVRLRHGFFWNYFERMFTKLKIQKESDFPCQKFDLNDEESFLIRVLYSDYNIIFEAFHGVADGRGALFFFNCLIARYIELKGETISRFIGCSSCLDLPSDEEVEDSFFRYYTTEKIKREKEKPAYKIKGNLMPAGMVNSVEGVMSVQKVKEVAKSYGVNISVFLSAVVGYCVYKRRKNSKKPTRISVPIDLRTRFESKTLRNFSSYINVEISGEDLSFEDVIEIFKNKFSTVDNKFLQANINANVKLQKNIFIKLIPLFLKNIILKTCFNYLGENYQTLAFSNIGKVEVPEEFEKYVESYTVNLGRSKHNEKSIGIITYKDKLSMCISSKIYETETERDIFKMLAKLSVPVTVYSNRRDLYGTK